MTKRLRSALPTTMATALLVLSLAVVSGCSAAADPPSADDAALTADAPADDETDDLDADESEASDAASDLDLTAVALPDGWPTEIPLPDQHTVVDTMSYPQADEQHHYIAVHSPQDANPLADELDSRIVGAGFTQDVRQETTHPALGGPLVTSQYTGPTYRVELTIHDYKDGGTYVQLKTKPLD